MILSGIPKIPYPFSAVAKHARRNVSPERLYCTKISRCAQIGELGCKNVYAKHVRGSSLLPQRIGIAEMSTIRFGCHQPDSTCGIGINSRSSLNLSRGLSETGDFEP